MSIQQEKQRLRRALIRIALSEEETRLLQERLFDLEEYKSAKSLFVYVSVFPEPDTRKVISLALGAGKRVAIPRIEGKGVMSARLIKGLYDLKPGPLSIPEPDDTAAILERADLCVVPCLACGRDFARLGHGGGYAFMGGFIPSPDPHAIEVCKRKNAIVEKAYNDYKVRALG